MTLAALLVVLALAAGGLAAWLYEGALRSNVGDLGFRNRLRVPPLLEPETDRSGRRVFDLTAATGATEFLSGNPTDTWGVNGSYLGPTLRARTGDRVRVHVTNHLDEPTTLHWHGMHLPAAMDGGPHQPIAPGATWSPEWTVTQPAATLWYHAHPAGRTLEQVYRGLAGLFLIDDRVSATSGLPHRYGVDDIPLIVQDKNFTGDGQLDTGRTRFSPIGPLGDEILVNGTHDPYLPVTTRLVRLRLLNASAARTYDFGFTDNRPFAAVASDAGLLPAPYELRRLRLAPSERAEIVVAVSPDDHVVLRSHPTGLGGGALPDRFAGADDSFDILRLQAASRLTGPTALPEQLPAPAPVIPPAGADRRVFTFNHASRINGHAYAPHRIDFSVAPGATEIWELRNGSDNPHVFHVHGVSFTVLSLAGSRPPPHLTGRKDSLLLPAGTAAVIVVRFGTHADPERPYMFHCHLMAHEDHGMMGQYTVTGGRTR
ncbi:multicopper oxidase family protein [Streptomyces regalis]|uniref:Copper oxidase n=1 Tax=Streptomyces regalis TaxID=68262 RepID=A0A101J8N8_9ACTN|nr:multicopper oxidase domain-containing protein [Streptomyces regalis]KUL22161.1 hypothetical protein ADL12_42745 [Streptomyces regalis]